MSSDSEDKNNLPPPKRSLTSLSLQWIAERLRKAERIRAEIAAGRYSVSSAEIAESLVSKPGDLPLGSSDSHDEKTS